MLRFGARADGCAATTGSICCWPWDWTTSIDLPTRSPGPRQPGAGGADEGDRCRQCSPPAAGLARPPWQDPDGQGQIPGLDMPRWRPGSPCGHSTARRRSATPAGSGGEQRLQGDSLQRCQYDRHHAGLTDGQRRRAFNSTDRRGEAGCADITWQRGDRSWCHLEVACGRRGLPDQPATEMRAVTGTVAGKVGARAGYRPRTNWRPPTTIIGGSARRRGRPDALPGRGWR